MSRLNWRENLFISLRELWELFLVYAVCYVVIKLERKCFNLSERAFETVFMYAVCYVVIKLERKSFNFSDRAFEIIFNACSLFYVVIKLVRKSLNFSERAFEIILKKKFHQKILPKCKASSRSFSVCKDLSTTSIGKLYF